MSDLENSSSAWKYPPRKRRAAAGLRKVTRLALFVYGSIGVLVLAWRVFG